VVEDGRSWHLKMKVSTMTETFIFNANIQLDEFHHRHALLGQCNSHERADFKHSLMHWIAFGLKEPELKFFFMSAVFDKRNSAMTPC